MFTLTKEEVEHIEEAEKKVVEITAVIEKTEEKIEAEEKKVISLEKEILKNIKSHPIRTLARGGFTRKEVSLLHSAFLRKLSKRKFLFTILVIFGVVLVWRGIWELTATLPILEYPIVALIVGGIVLWGIKKYTEL